ncbi:hypothetical protein [Haloarchaeobius litoreus]|uniref:Uncharacterized protein n=1 Tax=Haloarchaeobius litoreus TaxID=755306 RepID=A0ABD6DL42_9EURY|nr:hypothetical protein [Haloarchaeobius litoreus]
MSFIRRLFNQVDQWASNLSRARYAVFLGASAATGVLVVGLLLSEELYIVQAVAMGVVMLVLEYTFGKFQAAE